MSAPTVGQGIAPGLNWRERMTMMQREEGVLIEPEEHEGELLVPVDSEIVTTPGGGEAALLVFDGEE